MSELDKLWENKPQCNRPDGFCPAYFADWQMGLEGDFAKALTKTLKLLKKDTIPNPEAIKKLQDLIGQHSVMRKVLERAVGEMQRTGQLCDLCPFRKTEN